MEFKHLVSNIQEEETNMRKKIQDERAEDMQVSEKLSTEGTEGALEELLGKIRQVGRAFQHCDNGDILNYARLSQSLSEYLNSNVYLMDKNGSILGHAWLPGYSSQAFSDLLRTGSVMPEAFVEKANRYSESWVNDEDVYLFDNDADKKRLGKHLMYVPIYATKERLGTAVLVRPTEPFGTEDILMAEYLGTLVGTEMLYDRNRNVEKHSRDHSSVQMAMKALSYSEVESMKHVMGDLKGLEGVTVASKIADRVGVTRSVIVNALRKLESAGLIESRSLGMKGTYIKVLSPLFAKELGEATSGRIGY
jgi:transcriptional pleiotropic repressor